jgi:hypothetical protein
MRAQAQVFDVFASNAGHPQALSPSAPSPPALLAIRCSERHALWCNAFALRASFSIPADV